MIEKVMKAVKSSNKRRGRNITIGAVIGFLLSCTAVMGEDNYLWIKKENNEEIKFNKAETTEADGSDGSWDEKNPYSDNNWDKDTETYTYTNTIELSSSKANGVYEGVYGPGDNYAMSYGLRLSGDLAEVKFINNGSIIGIMNDESSSNSYGSVSGYGIYNSAEMGNIENTGVISGDGSSSSNFGEGYGIYNKSGTIGDIANTGVISGDGSSSDDSSSGYGINNESGTIRDITNIGVISGDGSSSGSYGSVSGYGINNESGTIGDITNIGVISGSGAASGSGSYASGEGYGINNESGTIGDITNIGVISGSGAASSYGYGYGIYNDSNDKEMGSITNIGIISGYSNSSNSYGYGYGIYNKSGTIGDITNIGIISGYGSSSASSGSGEGHGIHNDSNDKEIGNITNIGIINGIGESKDSQTSIAYGIYNKSGTIGDITNIGVISGIGKNSPKFGITYGIGNNEDAEKIGNITNIGIISATTGTGYGIYNSKQMGSITNTGIISGTSYGIYNSRQMGAITNTGVIYGKNNNAIKKYSGDIGASNNYGILVNGNDGEEVVNNLTIVNATPDKDNINLSKNEILNRGLIFKAVDGGYKVGEEDYKQFGAIYKDKEIVIGYEKDDENPDSSNPITKKYTIINAKAIESESDMTGINAATEEVNITGTESLKLENGILTYGDSQKEKISSGKGYILNGITDTLKVTKKHNELNDSIINAYKTAIVMEGDSTYLELNNTIVNGGLGDNSPVILTKGDKNFLTIKGDTIVNGEIKSEGSLNTLNLYGKENKSRSADNESMNILNDITGFGRIQIENDVTFFETAKVTGVERININNGGTLNLRLKKDEGESKATHALSSGNIDLLIAGLEKGGSSTEGTLNFITNGMGIGTVIDMGGAKLENVNLKTNSIVYKFEIVETGDSSADVGDIKLELKGSLEEIVNSGSITFDKYPKYSLTPDETEYKALDKIYQSSKTDDNMNALVEILDSSSDEEQWKKLLSFLGGIYTETPYSFSSELSRKSMGMFRDIITENQFKPNLNQWLVMGGLTHRDGGTKDSYYGQNYHEIDTGTADVDVDMKLTGAYALGKYGYSENISLGVTVGGNKSEAKLPMSKVKGNSGYIGGFAENYRGNLTLKAGAGIQYSEYDADRGTLGGHSYSEKYSDMAYDIYLNGRYSHNIGENLFLEPYGTLSYTYVDQEGADEGNKVLAVETDSKSFDYTAAKVGVDLKKVIPHEKGKSTLSAGVSYTRLLTGADEENITGRFKGGSDFDILVAHKNEHSIGLNAKYTLELENGVLFDVKGSYSVERDSHNGNGKNRNKGEWIIGAGLGYKF
ncbi:MAG: autotransporter outer membrane beta-barrel domain-containing protein [Fusobacterium varium]|uniref:autotransporter outer membrane beta-barrel domain-containing protein n=1 Tax=Fusobacterium varium TaxID=856 RepID=UPI00242ECC2F|nr:autotransporter outer membrane beta-barrel domain-containing protein [Fusobacterium varium]UYI77238.1 MAG: autotransporter outer membrane beta-barrel domain-containing protein [Fusobacterium varium]